MIDPITAGEMVPGAFKPVKKMFSMGRRMEETLGKVVRWYGAFIDFNEARGKQRIHLSFAGW